jgi:hypothetical protein
MQNYETLTEVKGLFKVIPLKLLRQTKGVIFDLVPVSAFKSIDAIDRVIHEGGAFSPGSVGSVERPWYMHQHQEDNLVVLAGSRDIDLYSLSTRESVHFTVFADKIHMNGSLWHDHPVMLSWPTGVFHRIVSNREKGSASINIAVRHQGFDIKTNFSIYDLDTETGEYQVIREGHLDQPM